MSGAALILGARSGILGAALLSSGRARPNSEWFRPTLVWFCAYPWGERCLFDLVGVVLAQLGVRSTKCGVVSTLLAPNQKHCTIFRPTPRSARSVPSILGAAPWTSGPLCSQGRARVRLGLRRLPARRHLDVCEALRIGEHLYADAAVHVQAPHAGTPRRRRALRCHEAWGPAGGPVEAGRAIRDVDEGVALELPEVRSEGRSEHRSEMRAAGSELDPHLVSPTLSEQAHCEGFVSAGGNGSGP